MTDSSQEIAIFEGENGEIAVTLQQDTVWLNQAQLAALFAKNKRTISEHIRNLFKEGELEESAVVRNFRTTASDGKSYDTQHYNLDVIISVGYRVKSPQGVRFRQWATRLLKQHLIQGYTLNQQRFEQNACPRGDLNLLVAESVPAQKDTLIRLIINMLSPTPAVTDFGTTP
ncbi:RhuM family protein [Craterilacuibacter sp. RT1T]|uniref:virulence RhuM family protein n=1 Tax=Craterilacuibacter sp. RT1T TaxID=2942211 RepID=UPI0020BE5C68|nr:RhuM family protein [Craterilacuibacter sp. RT1T]MCL6262904.1 virulence RhuM family protein [Craterilacuibacter sp. RT1T]